MPYIYFTDQQKEQAAGVDLAAFLESQGETHPFRAGYAPDQ